MDGTTMTRAQRDSTEVGLGGVQTRRQVLRHTGSAALVASLLAGGLPAPLAVAADAPAIVGSWYVIRSTPIAGIPGTSPLTHWTMIFMADGTLMAQVAPVALSPTGVMTVASVASGVWGQLATAGTFGFTQLQVRSDGQTGKAFGLPRWIGTIALDPGDSTFAISYRDEILDLDTLAVERQVEQVDGKGMRIVLDPSLQ